MSDKRFDGETLVQREGRMELTPHARFVEAEQFVNLLVSRKKLIREDDKEAGIRGLFEPATGKSFFIEEEKLLASEPS